MEKKKSPFEKMVVEEKSGEMSPERAQALRDKRDRVRKIAERNSRVSVVKLRQPFNI